MQLQDKYSASEIITLGYVGNDTKRIHQSGMVFGTGGAAPTLYAVMYKEPMKIVVKRKATNENPDE